MTGRTGIVSPSRLCLKTLLPAVWTLETDAERIFAFVSWFRDEIRILSFALVSVQIFRYGLTMISLHSSRWLLYLLNCLLTILSFDGGWFYPPFLRIIFTAKTRHFQRCLRLWSRGHQVRGHPCKWGKVATFFYAKKYTCSIIFTIEKPRQK